MYCEKCGKPLGEEDRFCGYCGAPTGGDENTNPDTAEIPVAEEPRNTDSGKHEEEPAAKQGSIKERRGIMLLMGAIVLFLVCLCIFAISGGKESDGNDRAGDDSIKPEKVQEEMQEKAERTEESSIEKPLLKIARGYDENGNLVREITYDRDGSRMKYEYDPDGNLITETSFDEQGHQTIQYTYDNTGNLIREFELEYDSEGNRIKERFFSPDSPHESIWEYEYDNDGKVIKKSSMDDLISTYEYTYEDNDRIKRIDRYELNTGSTGSLELEYDSSGKLIQFRVREYSMNERIVDFNSVAGSTSDVSYDITQGTISQIREEEYDRDGTLLAIHDYDDGGEVRTSQEYEHDSRGRCIKYSTIVHGSLEMARTYGHAYEYEYDINGQLKVERYYDGEGNLNYEITMEYEYYE